MRCFERVDEQSRQLVFDKFWALADYNIQNAYLFGQVEAKEPSRRYRNWPSVAGQSRRTRTWKYNVLVAGTRVMMCLKAFLSIHGISETRVRTARGERRPSEVPTPPTDCRGNHDTRPRKISDESRQCVRDHISSFPRYTSHYSRRDNPNRRYLQGVSSVSEMYSMYVSQCTDSSTVAVKEHRYIFNYDFNLSFKLPHSDTCQVCDQATSESAESTTAVVIHQLKAKAAYDRLKQDRQRAQNDPSLNTIAFDLQQALPTPMIPTEIVFYMRQLWTYNLGVHNCSDESATMIMWPENMASRGADEIASCLLKYFQLNRVEDKRHLIAYSDSCGGQNKNSTIVSLWLYLILIGRFDRIEHKFLLPGHTYLPVDSDFGVIEKRKKITQHVYTPSDWCTVVRSSRKKNPFTVVEMERQDFQCVTELKKCFCNRKVTVSKQKVAFRKIMWMSFDKDCPYEFRFKYSHNEIEAWQIVNMRKRGASFDFSRLTFTMKYLSGRPINSKKLADIQKLINLSHQFTMSSTVPSQQKILALTVTLSTWTLRRIQTKLFTCSNIIMYILLWYNIIAVFIYIVQLTSIYCYYCIMDNRAHALLSIIVS